jgi:5-methylcytosine-specific restriction endonuclease McrA
MYPKPEAHAKVKARQLRTYARDRQACVVAVWTRAQHRCEYCGRWVEKPRETDDPFKAGHVHERIARSQGGDPTNPDDCVLSCHPCHFNGPSGAHRKSERVGH